MNLIAMYLGIFNQVFRKHQIMETALIKVIDENGSLLKADARELFQVKELSTVVVQGKAQRDDAGNLTVLARGVYVKKSN